MSYNIPDKNSLNLGIVWEEVKCIWNPVIFWVFLTMLIFPLVVDDYWSLVY